MPCSDVPRLKSSTQCRTTHTSSSRCQALEESSRSTETLNVLSERRNIQRHSRQKYSAASYGSSRVRPLSDRTRPNLPGVTYNKTTWHVLSTRSNAAPTPAPAKLQDWSFASFFSFFYPQDSVHQRPYPAVDLPNSRCNIQGRRKATTNTQVVSIMRIKSV